jgi:hypothetical protein
MAYTVPSMRAHEIGSTLVAMQQERVTVAIGPWQRANSSLRESVTGLGMSERHHRGTITRHS